MAEFVEIRGGNELKSGQMKMFNMGRMLKSPRPVKTYRVKVEAGKVMVEVDKAACGIA